MRAWKQQAGVRTAEWDNWPKKCPGTCGRMTRPWNGLIAQFPDTVVSVNKKGYCDPCRRAAAGVPARKVVEKPRKAASEALTAERVEALERWRLRYEAERRRRGIPPEGTVPDDHEAAFDPPEVPNPGPDYGLGMDSAGHFYDGVDSKGRRMCSVCKSFNGAKGHNVAKTAPVEGKCRYGHQLTQYSDGKLYCRICRNRDKRRWREKRKAAGLPATYHPSELRAAS